MVEITVTPGQKAILDAMARDGRHDEIAGLYVASLISGDVACARHIVRNHIHLMGPDAVAMIELVTGAIAVAMSAVDGSEDGAGMTASLLGDADTVH